VNQQSGQFGFATERVGPNKLSFIGLLQPMSDTVKWFLKRKHTRPCFCRGLGKIIDFKNATQKPYEI